ncbi:hypothetical protein ACTXT7_006328 [Hymenolepis weldensis]
MRTKTPATVMVFDVGLRVNAYAHVETPQTIVTKPSWIDNVANGGRAPMSANKIRLHPMKLSRIRIEWMAENFHHHVAPNLRPPNYSPDLNPFDYYVIEKEVTKHPHNTIFLSLMEGIARIMEDINKLHLI